MTPEYFDIHSHLNFSQYDADREEVIRKMKEEKVWTITVGVDLETSKEAVALAEKHEGIFSSIGIHPIEESSEVRALRDAKEERFDEAEFAKLVSSPKVVAIGECGLDYSRLASSELESAKSKDGQKKLFEQQIDFAVKYDKPLMIHCRSSLRTSNDGYEDALEILKSKQKIHGEKVRGNFHFFTSPIEVAKRCLEIGFTVSFTGPITFVSDYEDIVRYVPLNMMMAETDAPFAAPAPFRGRRNSPLYVKEIVKKIAEIKGEDFEKVKRALVDNTFRMFL